MDLALADLFAPPEAFDLEWRDAGDGEWAAAATAVFLEAWNANFPVLERNGYRAEGKVPRFATWRRADLLPIRESVAARAVSTLARVDENARVAVERAAVEAERLRPLRTVEIANVQRRATMHMTFRPWLIPRRLHETATVLADAEALTRGQATFLRGIVEEAEDRLARIDARLASPAGEEASERVRSPAIRMALWRAVAAITAADEDRAAHRNGVGWDAASSDAGHRLASFPDLDERAAAHAWVIVHRHRRQVPPAIRAELYGDAGVSAPAA